MRKVLSIVHHTVDSYFYRELSDRADIINSIIGHEILPSASDPATAKIYKITESDKAELRFEYKGMNHTVKYSGKGSKTKQIALEQMKLLATMSSEL